MYMNDSNVFGTEWSSLTAALKQEFLSNEFDLKQHVGGEKKLKKHHCVQQTHTHTRAIFATYSTAWHSTELSKLAAVLLIGWLGWLCVCKGTKYNVYIHVAHTVHIARSAKKLLFRMPNKPYSLSVFITESLSNEAQFVARFEWIHNQNRTKPFSVE